MSRFVNLAANPIVIGDRVIQRCFVCGLKLVDNLGVAAPIGPNGELPTIGTWEVGALVAVSGSFPVMFELVRVTERPQFDAPWEDCCLGLVES